MTSAPHGCGMTEQLGEAVRDATPAYVIDLDRGSVRSHRRRGRRWVRVVVVVTLALLLAAAGAAVGGRLLFAHVSRSMVHAGGPGRAAAEHQRIGSAHLTPG